MTSASSRFVVVGAGLAGAATAWQLARRGHEVTVLERTRPANNAGSSHGSARILRYAYADPFYANLVVKARGEWDDLETLAGHRLISRTGALDFGAERSPALLSRVLDNVGVDHEVVACEDARDRWPQLAFDSDVLWHADAGVIDSESAVGAMLALAVGHGAAVQRDWPVAAVTRERSGYRVTRSDGCIVNAAQVIVTVGGWLPDLLAALPLPEAFRHGFPPLQVMQENVYHFPYRDEHGDWPTFIHKAPGLQTYGLPGGRDAGFRGQKVAEYNGGRPIGTASAQTAKVDPANRERIVDYVSRTLPGLVPEPYAETTCLFTNTPTEDFVIDSVDGLTVVSPCSGHGAKFAPLVGGIAAESALGKAAPARFRVNRVQR